MHSRSRTHHGSHSKGNIIFQDISRIKLPFLGQIIQYLKVINEDMCEKAYFYLIYNQLLIFEF